jgi:ribosomal protein L37AE/L43A
MDNNQKKVSQGVIGKKCPKCHYVRVESDTAPEWQCPGCGVAYAKVEPTVETLTPKNESADVTASEPKAQPGSKAVLGEMVPKKKVIVIAVACLVVGYFAGREHLKYEVRSAIGSAFSGFSSAFNSGPGAASAEPDKKAKSSFLDNPFVPSKAPVTATLLSKGFEPSNPSARQYDDFITFKLNFKNTEARDIRAFEGVVQFMDLLDNELLSANVAINDPIQGLAQMDWPGQIDYNQFRDSHKRLRSAEFGNIKLKFNLRKVLYTDGTVEEFR